VHSEALGNSRNWRGCGEGSLAMLAKLGLNWEIRKFYPRQFLHMSKKQMLKKGNRLHAPPPEAPSEGRTTLCTAVAIATATGNEKPIRI